MDVLKTKLEQVLPRFRSKRARLLEEYGDTAIANVTVEQVIGGMRGVPSVLCDTSSVSPSEGLRIRGIPILELTEATPEEIFFLLVTGERPTADERQQLSRLLSTGASVPPEALAVLQTMHQTAHPMAMLSAGLLAIEHRSAFRKAYEEGAPKDRLWEYTLADCILLLSSITSIAAAIYRLKFRDGTLIEPDPALDWSTNFARMLGVSNDPAWADLVRLYLVLHADHEGGNVSAFTGITVASALSDVFYAVSAALNGLAGPLHGLANQECLAFILDIRERFGGVPTEDQLRELCWERLRNGQVIPGYGHAVLRVTDPRFIAFYNFAEKYQLHDDCIAIAKHLYNVVPDVLREHGKAKNPYPNVDAISGSLLYDLGMTEFTFYTVMFGVSRALGICAQILFHRMVGSPIVRPKSVTLDELEQLAQRATTVPM
ncbi:MAG: citrate (Si)-synthase [Bacteroidota bacterium]|nr:citrate (Si)-synthase [Candidatus Kapabacteria bacterium]MDW8074871.1 citrate (Si)-synthase [Bacteroidota bacterium]